MDKRKFRADRLTPRNVALSDEAIDWIVLLGSGSATDEDRAAFKDWCDRSPAHAAAASEAAQMLDQVCHTDAADEYREIGAALRVPRPQVHREPVRHHISRRAVLGGGVAAVAAAGIVTSGVFGPASGWLADHATGVGERRKIALDDGSIVWLNTSSALSIDFSSRERRLTLHAGEALFEVAKDKARPFIVASGSGEARAVGTVYSVRQRGSLSDVVVSEGIVEVRTGSEIARLTAGQRIAYGDSILSAIHSADARAETGWARGKLIFNRRPLAEVAQEMERYQHGKVVVAGDRLGGIEVTGVFDLDDTDALLRAISATTRARITTLPLLTIIH